MKKIIFILIVLLSAIGHAQVTSAAMSGMVRSNKGEALPGATVEILHTPTGTKYFSTTDFDGGYSAQGLRPGGPYTVKVSYIGYKTTAITDITAGLGNNLTVNVTIEEEQNALQEVVVTTKSKGNFNKGRTGASQQFSNREIAAVPVLGARSINSVTKYNANAGANGTFGGQDSRLNNFTIDGSVFNNGFGLGSDSQAGGRTGSTAISLDAIEQLQVNIAPYDVRQSGFLGSGINAVTRSGTNEIEGSVYTSTRSNKKSFIGTHPGSDITIVPGKFEEKIWGARIGAPIIKDKLFFFGNLETIDNTSPATTWTSTGSPNPSGQISNPTYTQMETLSNFMRDKFGYETGPWENYDAAKTSKKFLTRIDWNINDNHKLTARYVFHNSSSDELTSNSASLGFGNRRTSNLAMSYKNSGYTILDNTRSIVVELNSKFGNSWYNNFIAGYDKQIEDRGLQGGGLFPTIDIKNGTATTTGTTTLISVGLDPFTQGNKLTYSTLHFTDNLTKTIGKHSLLLGANFEYFKSSNLFFQGSNGVFIFNSLDDFYAAATESVNNGGAPSTTVATLPVRTQFRYSALPGGAEPLQILKSNKIDLYAQDEMKLSDKFKLTVGLRASRVWFADTALENPAVTAMTFANGEKFNTGDLPDAQYLFEPRLGFNLDLNGNASTIVRGGSGIFTGRAPSVYLSNQIGNNGVLSGVVDASTTNVATGGYGFTPRPADYFTPATPTLPATFDLAFTDKKFKYPQVWKTTMAVDQKLPFGFVGTVEGILQKNINAINYYNANFDAPVGTFVGTDNRPRYSRNDAGTRVNDNVSNGIVLTNSDKGYFYSTTFKLEYPYQKGLWGSFAYTHSEATDLISPGSVASGSWTGARSVNGNNDLDVSLSNNNTPHRLVGVIGYRIEYGKGLGGATSINLGYIGEQSSPFSYAYSGDMNGDLVNGNDLLYVPNNANELRFSPLTVSSTVGGVTTTRTYTEAEQRTAFDAYIDQDKYLRTRRGKYAERNGAVLPMLHRLDLSISQDIYIKIAGKKNSFQFRADILNFTNMLNKDWGISQRATNANVLAYNTTTANVPFYRLATQTDVNGNRFLIKDTFQKNASTFDVWQAQFTLRYTFGN
ncbi:carboxypeptidase-like regulatory domain-containing protein [Flavobacterium sp. Fl-77]|uniref:Carboxypeptidase-like regulatory domain-containing protein n=1 Tax=Flavobacterium flavipigmentatum TaxID=2893884 RepID=A0AAJ2S4J0_9FLAO|nr:MULTISPECIES: carboxypeptidase-like regulatory domain-containing protein [unclassified Flavobacterium]MDX6180753.1 carboxypeptidase-like regulatory domain-containing protein [Flavobacterium sp. Fl-33]MDX6184353.1 carboxypeptidase-like regulatory domain-containing protein [Flavobacterium sp. Fl-77]UFH39462.1 carboxypeptidase-like regulatory domain-containing protein [Flavobacterium sp. F-70]